MASSDFQRIVVLMPNWLGDGVMATPLLRGLRVNFPQAHIAAAANKLVAPALDGLADLNEIHITSRAHTAETRRWLRAGRFDLGIILPNSFRAAWLLFQGKIGQRIGYARDARSLLLTKRCKAIPRTAEQRRLDRAKEAAIRTIGQKKSPPIGSPYQPMPTIDYYLHLLTLLGCSFDDRTMHVAITPADQREMTAALGEKSPGERWATMIPGAHFGSSKCWPPEHFAALSNHLIAAGTVDRILLAGAPREAEMIDAIVGGAAEQARQRMVALPRVRNGAGISIGALKAIIGASDLVVSNDTGPRHIAAALGRPLVTLFGPTDPRWAETFAANERIVRLDVPCGPCQLKQCPIDHRCMRDLSVELVIAAVHDVLANSGKSTINPRTPLRQL